MTLNETFLSEISFSSSVSLSESEPEPDPPELELPESLSDPPSDPRRVKLSNTGHSMNLDGCQHKKFNFRQ